ncbi:hypothetical protein BKA70DRAFT_1249708 [Coprinopsis sp. MPI-PUGE-AT-0042]|nr:hypothetical protein BKA70DRAFT_1249708 [Coprinopsis sp. MPI-PUGE-AT-0042]
MDSTDTTALVSDFHAAQLHSVDSTSSTKPITISRRDENEAHITVLEAVVAHQDLAPSHIGRLPTEIIAHVFFLATGQGVVILYAPDATPWNIAGVCRYWKAVVYSTPAVWNHVAIDWGLLTTLKTADAKVYVERLCYIVGLSSSLPLFLHPARFPIRGQVDHYMQDPGGSIWRLLDRTLQDAWHRLWGKLPIWSLTKRVTAEDASSITLTIPKVDTLLIQSTVRELVSRNITIKLPSLETLELDDIGFALFTRFANSSHTILSYIHTFMIQHHTLRRLVWHDSPTQSFLYFADDCHGFREVPSLEELCLTGKAPRPYIHVESDNPNSSLHIRKLEIHQEWHQIASHLSSLRAPALTTLDVRNDKYEYEQGLEQNRCVAEAIRTFVQKSGCQHTLVSIKLDGLDGINLTHLLKLTPNLLELIISSLWSDSLASNPSVVPVLQQVTVDASNDESIVMPDVLANILTIRHPDKKVYSSKSFKKTWALVKMG